MLRRDRESDQDFEADESFFLRISKEHIGESGKLNAGCIRFLDQSCNRSKYAEPEDVLIGEPGNKKSRLWLFDGVARFPVSEMPGPLPVDDPICEIRIVHVPLGWNYAHSELRTYKGGVLVRKKANSKRDKRARDDFRLLVRDLADMLIQPLQ